MDIVVTSANQPLHATLSDLPGDKSISHRAIILGAIAQNTSQFSNFLFGEDCLATIRHFQTMGIEIQADPQTKKVIVVGKGKYGLTAPAQSLDCGNSGTTIRLMTGLLAAQKFTSTLTGDASILKRPMKRVINPLSQMGAKIQGHTHPGKADLYPPLTFTPVPDLKPITYTLPVASAQVKSAILLASLYMDSPTTIIEPEPTRDHSERMLTWYGADLHRDGTQITCSGRQDLKNPTNEPIHIPADISSAAFFIVLGLIYEDANLLLKGVGFNPTRDRICGVLQRMGAKLSIESTTQGIEPYGDIRVQTSKMTNVTLEKSDIPILIDELPILAVAALFAKGTMKVRHAQELRHKESDRLAAIGRLVVGLGGRFQEFEDGFDCEGPVQVKSFTFDSHGDHRMAMAAIIGAIAARVPATVKECECIQTSFPNFMEILSQLGALR